MGHRDGDVRFIVCPECGGDGGFEHIHNDRYPSSPNGDPDRSWVPCIGCDGQGESVIVTSLIDFYDLGSEQ